MPKQHSKELQAKTCAKCGLMRKITLFKPRWKIQEDGTKVKIRANNCSFCASGKDPTQSAQEESTLVVLKIQNDRLFELYSQLQRDFENYKLEVLDGFRIVNGEIETVKSKI